jgi:hypothetical protein
MKTTRSTLAAAALAAALAAGFALCGVSARAQNQTRSARPDPSFDVLSRKSIFSRDRRPATTQAQAGSGSAGRVLSPEQSLAFRGVMVPDEETVAFIENIVTQAVTVVRPGDKLGPGQAGFITLETLQYIDPQGKTHDIRLGQDLTGQVASASGGGYSTGSPAGAVAGGGTTGPSATTPSGAAPPAGDTSSVAERMRRNRQEGR